jgi:hypothetical protein
VDGKRTSECRRGKHERRDSEGRLFEPPFCHQASIQRVAKTTLKKAGEIKAEIARHSVRIETLRRHARLFSEPSKQIRFAAETEVGESEAFDRLLRQVVAEVHQQLPELAEACRRTSTSRSSSSAKNCSRSMD